MQGESPADAFTSLPASMRGADEGADDVLTLDPLVPVAPVKGAPKERLWSLDKEQVSVKSALWYMCHQTVQESKGCG